MVADTTTMSGPWGVHVHSQVQEEGWRHHLNVNLGRLPLSPVDWVDQVWWMGLPWARVRAVPPGWDTPP